MIANHVENHFAFNDSIVSWFDICSALSTSDEVSVFDSRVAANSATNPYAIPTFESYSGERINFSMSQFQWSDYTSFVSQISSPDVMHFIERQDNTILILLNPGHNGQMINNETFVSGDSILLNINRDGAYINSKAFDSGHATDNRRYGFTVIIDSPDQSNLSLLGTFPAKQSSYGIVNNFTTIIGGQYGHQWG